MKKEERMNNNYSNLLIVPILKGVVHAFWTTP